MPANSNRIAKIAQILANFLAVMTISVVGAPFAQADIDLQAEFFSFDQVKAIIAREQITSVKDLIPHLPESYRRNFTLMKQSRSSQGATPESPRVLMFGKTAQSVITFNGSPELKGFETIEMEEFNPKTQAFEFHQIKFENGQAEFSAKNPAACVGCHLGSQNELRPNWDNYSTWAGAFGERDDRVGAKEQAMLEWDPQKALQQLMNSEETKQLQNFIAQKDQSPYYKNLIVDATTPVSPYTYEDKGTLRNRPNERLTLLLARWNAKKIVRMMKADARYSLLRNLILTPYTDAKAALTAVLEKNIFTPDETAKIQANAASVGDAVFDILPFSPRDWNLAFLTSQTSRMQAPNGFTHFLDRHYHDGVENAMRKHVYAELARDWFHENPALRSYYLSDVTPAGDSSLAKGYPDIGVFDEIGADISGQAFTRPDVLKRLLESNAELLDHAIAKKSGGTLSCKKIVE